MMNTLPDEAPALEISGPVARLTLRRPRVHNRLNEHDVELLQHHLADLDSRPEIRVLVLTGTGASFSSGFDLGNFEEQLSQPGQTAFEALTDALERVMDFPWPSSAELPLAA